MGTAGSINGTYDLLHNANNFKIYSGTLLNYSADFSSLAITSTLSDLQSTLTNIKGATDKANEVIGKIRTFDKVIRIAAAATVLGAAIASSNPGGIADAVKAVCDATSS